MDLSEIKAKLKNYSFAWVGQNATTGTPNKITGRHSMYGDFIVFRNRKERDQFVDNYSSFNPSNFAVKVNLQSGRKYDLGSSVLDYHFNLLNVATYDLYLTTH